MISSKTSPKDMDLVREGLGSRLDDPAKLPISYVIDGQKYIGIPQRFHPVCERRVLDANISERTWRARVKGLDVKVEGFEYKDSATFEWTVYFSNNGRKNSPVISEFYGADFKIKSDRTATVFHNNGDYCAREGLETSETTLHPGEKYEQHNANGRSCDRAWPYYRILCENFGYNIAIGWPGNWKSEFSMQDDGLVFRAKQARTNFYLKPGETVRSPRICFMAFEGDYDRGVNVWRNFYFAHMLCRTRGSALTPKSNATFSGGGEEFTLASEENQLQAIDRNLKAGYKPDIWWIDAGWYPCKDENGIKRWVRTGDWRLDPEKWPNGLGAVGKKCKENGIQLLLWFEPERVVLRYWPETNPQDYLLKIKTPVNDWIDSNGLLYLGNDDAREWLTNKVKGILSEGGVEIYRQDFNGAPFPVDVWAQNDAEDDRAGITENLHIQGYLKFWDDLLFDIPDMWIDSCASGGRRNDIEAMRRAVPLHPTDYGYGEHPVKQAFQKTWFEWTPYFRSIARSWDDENGNYGKGKSTLHGFDSYAMHCAFGAVSNIDLGSEPDKNIELNNLRKKAAAYTLGGSDFFALTPVRKSNEDYFAIQFDREDTKDGLIQVIRNTRCEEESITIFPKQFDNAKQYEFYAPENGEKKVVSGEEINTNGFTVSIPKRSGIFWFYRSL